MGNPHTGRPEDYPDGSSYFDRINGPGRSRLEQTEVNGFRRMDFQGRMMKQCGIVFDGRGENGAVSGIVLSADFRPEGFRWFRSGIEASSPSPESIRRAPESIRRAPESIRRAPESIRRAPESIRRAPESIRRAPESIRRGFFHSCPRGFGSGARP